MQDYDPAEESEHAHVLAQSAEKESATGEFYVFVVGDGGEAHGDHEGVEGAGDVEGLEANGNGGGEELEGRQEVNLGSEAGVL